MSHDVRERIGDILKQLHAQIDCLPEEWDALHEEDVATLNRFVRGSWTSEKPTEPGWYWFRWFARDAGIIVEVQRQGGFLVYKESPLDWQILPISAEWCGPLSSPMEAP